MPSSTDSTAAAPANVLCDVLVPRETVNDDTVTIQSWHAAHGEAVRKGQRLVSIETSKAVLEVESEFDGFLSIVHPQGADVPIGALIGRVLSAPAAAATPAPVGRLSEPGGSVSSENAHRNGHATTAEPAAGPRSSNRLRDRMNARASETAVAATSAVFTGTTDHSFDALPAGISGTPIISKKAQRLIEEHNLVPARDFPNVGMLRERDVIRFLEARVHAQPPAPAAQSASPAATPTHAEPAAAALSPEGAAAAQDRTKVASRYEKPGGAKGGSKGLFGDAAASAKDRGNKSVLWLAWNYLWRNWFLGHAVRVAPRGVILTLHKWRGVKMGRDVFIDPTAIVETAFPENITIGDDVRITAGCVIMTHIKAPHYLRETGLVPVVLKPVVLEDHCFIGVNSVIMPGVTVGKASVVTSGSVVVNNVPPYTMVQGNPAKVIKQFPRPE